MMNRGTSFVTDLRVPTHLVLFMTTATSIDVLVQAAGRATFLRREVLERNGWVDETGEPVVRVLMPQADLKVVKAYPKLMVRVDEHLRRGTSIDDLFCADGPGALANFSELDGLKETIKRFGDRRKQYSKSWLGMPEEEEATDGDEGGLGGHIERLRLPSRHATIWVDDSSNHTWSEYVVSAVRKEPHCDGPIVTLADIEFRLTATDAPFGGASTGEWRVLDRERLHGDGWYYTRAEIERRHPCDAIHVPPPQQQPQHQSLTQQLPPLPRRNRGGHEVMDVLDSDDDANGSEGGAAGAGSNGGERGEGGEGDLVMATDEAGERLAVGDRVVKTKGGNVGLAGRVAHFSEDRKKVKVAIEGSARFFPLQAACNFLRVAEEAGMSPGGLETPRRQATGKRPRSRPSSAEYDSEPSSPPRTRGIGNNLARRGSQLDPIRLE